MKKLLVLLLAVSLYCGDAFSQDIVGFVRNGATNQAIIGAVVNINGDNNDYLSQNDGSFRINGKPSGKYTLSAKYQNYQSAQIVVDHNAEKNSQVNFNLALSPNKENKPPTIPLRISPQNIVVSDINFLNLNWYSIDPDGDPVVYRVFFDTDSSRLKPIKAFYKFDKLTVANIPYDKQYFWKIIARDDKGAESEGPVWSFILKKETESEEEEEECLVAHWSFDDDNGEDKSGNGLTASPAGSYTYGEGISGNCIKLNGIGTNSNAGGHVILPRVKFEEYEEFTISLWVNYKSFSYIHGEFLINFGLSNSGWLGMAIHTDIPYDGTPRRLRFATGSKWRGESDDIIPLTADLDLRFIEDKWRMLTMTYKNGIITSFLDDEMIDYRQQDLNIVGDNYNAIGRHWWLNGSATSTRLTADIDEVKIYCKAMTEEEVGKMYKKIIE